MITGQCWPLAALPDRRLKCITPPGLVESALKAAQRARLTDRETTAAAAFLRVRLKPASEWVSGTEPPEVTTTGRIGPGRHESVSVFSSSPVIRRTLKRLARQAGEVWTAGNAGALCKELGLNETDLRAAIRQMECFPL